MGVDELIREGEAIARPCLLLSSESGDRICGYWGGERSDKPNVVPVGAANVRSIQHMVSVDATLLPELGIPPCSGVIAIFEVETERGRSHRIEYTPDLDFSDVRCNGIALASNASTSFPPLEALCLYGSDRVKAWLSAIGAERYQYDIANAHPAGEEYHQEYTRRAPFYVSDAEAILGGWHMTWPEDDFYIPLEMRLALMTLRDAEPWIEFWRSDMSLQWSVRERIT